MFGNQWKFLAKKASIFTGIYNFPGVKIVRRWIIDDYKGVKGKFFPFSVRRPSARPMERDACPLLDFAEYAVR